MNNKHNTVDFLIVGQGLAGSLTAWTLAAKGKRVAVIDNGAPFSSSKVAAGLFNPINPKRYTVAGGAEKFIKEALDIYKSIEQKLGVSLVHEQNIYNVFGNTKEGNDYTLKLDHPFFKQHTNGSPSPEKNILQPFGAFEVTGLCGWIDLKLFLSSIRNWLQQEHVFKAEQFDYSKLIYQDSQWTYGDIKASQVICCEGHRVNNNPYFKHLNIIPCKGDVLEFEAPGLEFTRIIKKGVYIVQIGPQQFRCGSTYHWFNDDETPLAEDREELVSKIKELIEIPFTITSHISGIRPTTKTREIIVNKHPDYPGLYAVNGLGTKGVMNGIKAMRQLMDTLEL